MADPERIPLGDDFFIDTSGMQVGGYTVSEGSQVTKSCYETCDLDEMASFRGTQAVAELCMQHALRGGEKLESVIEVDIQCRGPKRKILGGRKCGAKVTMEQVVKPLEDTPRDDMEEQTPEIIKGFTLATLIADSVKNADRSMESSGLLWTDKALDMPGVSRQTHVAVGSREGKPVEVDINQSKNPFTPARITYDLSGTGDRLVLKHNGVADEGGRTEYFAMEDRVELDRRVTELFQQYFL